MLVVKRLSLWFMSALAVASVLKCVTGITFAYQYLADVVTISSAVWIKPCDLVISPERAPIRLARGWRIAVLRNQGFWVLAWFRLNLWHFVIKTLLAVTCILSNISSTSNFSGISVEASRSQYGMDTQTDCNVFCSIHFCISCFYSLLIHNEHTLWFCIFYFCVSYLSVFFMVFICFFSSTCCKTCTHYIRSIHVSTLHKFVLISHDILTLWHKYISKVFYRHTVSTVNNAFFLHCLHFPHCWSAFYRSAACNVIAVIGHAVWQRSPGLTLRPISIIPYFTFHSSTITHFTNYQKRPVQGRCEGPAVRSSTLVRSGFW